MKQCTALALSAGGVRGAYQAGAIKGLIYQAGPDAFVYDVIQGTSIGSINAAAMSMWPKDEGVNMANYVYSIWEQNSLYDTVKWKEPFHLTKFDSKKIKSFIKDILVDTRVPNSGFQRKLSVCVTQILEMHYRTIHLDQIQPFDLDQVVQAIVASMSNPFTFGLVDYLSEKVVDGGVQLAVDPEDAILRCLEEVGDQSDIILDIINVAGRGFDVIKGTIPPNQEGWDDGWHQISDVMDLYPTMQYRYLMAPSFDVLQKFGLFETDHDK